MLRKLGPAWLVLRRNPFLPQDENHDVPQPGHGASWTAKWESPRRKRPDPGHLTHNGAVAKLAEAILAREHEIDAEPDGPQKKTVVTFGQVADAWLDERRADVRDQHMKRSTLKDYASMLKRPTDEARSRARKAEDGKRREPAAWIMRTFDERPIKGIDWAEVERFEQAMRRAGLSPRTRTKYLTVVGMILDHAKDTKIIERSPMADRPKAKRKPRKRNGIPKVYDSGVVEQIAAAAEDPFGDMIRLAALTGLRQGELLALRWRSVDFVGRKLTIEATYGGSEVGEDLPKSGAARTVPMSDRAGAVLDDLSRREEWTAAEDLVFGQSDGNARKGRAYVWTNIDGSTVRRKYMAARDAAIKGTDLPVLPFHALRHCFGSDCAAAGVPIGRIQQWMGHADIKTTMIYVHWAPQHDDADILSRAQARGTAAEAMAVAK